MTNHIGQLIRRKREEQGLKRSELAAKVGYSNISKGSRKVTEIERDGIVRPDLLKKLIKILHVSKEEYQKALQKEKDEFDAFLDTPVPMKMIVRYAPAVYLNQNIPDHVKSKEDAVQYIKCFTAEKNLKACLVLDRRWSFWAESGEGVWRETTYENQINRPYMTIGGKPFQISADTICDG